MVYIINRKSTDQYKVGISKSPEKRLKQLQTGSGDELILIKVFNPYNDRLLEKQIHALLKPTISNRQKSMKGEWFSIDSNWLRTIIFEIEVKLVFNTH